MTRDKALEAYDDIDYADNYFTSGRIDTESEKLINKIYNEFESRTCNNCKHLNMSKFHTNEGCGDMYIPCDLIYVETTGANTLQEFGCNMFKRGDCHE